MSTARQDWPVDLARADELEALRRIEAAAATLFPPQDLPPALAQHQLSLQALEQARAAGLLWVVRAAASSQPVAFLLAEACGDCLHLAEMDVLPSHGRRGIGAALLARAGAEAAARGLAWLTLSTFEHLPWNGPFYARQGFRPFDEEEASGADSAAFPHLAARLAAERGLGLARRIGMVRPVASPEGATMARQHRETWR
ncbi:GNAT family N-acetyltransferase [Roseateles sp. DAIF2]|uniref:GNAT family N-acetyltransferase n=1 Tax=Roseateles sp. DAIF2 TaxID=2714952 RepID=UPI0018A2C61A|nr:GNAT family N-acetyltransferase [Roseateles sp. DAIF2]QPF75941.1 GNAT family N-acetyltransferase [Roseateles sp. DAIF2]